MQAVKDWIEAGTKEVFENTRIRDLLDELELAKSLGVKPMHVDDPGFSKVANQDTSLKWAVTESGDLLFVPHCVRGEEIAHTVLTQGDPVVATGEAVIFVDGNQRYYTEMTNHSGHYLPDEASLEIGKQAFKIFGIPRLGDDSGKDDGGTEDINEIIYNLSGAIPTIEHLIIEPGRTLSRGEQVIAEKLARAVAEEHIPTSDFLVDGVATELKTVSNITTKDISGTLGRMLLLGGRQAPHVIADTRQQAEVTIEIAERAIRRAYGADILRRIQQIRIIGKDFDITIPRQ